MGAALFLPFTGFYGDGIVFGSGLPAQVSQNLLGGANAWLVVGIVVALGIFAAFNVAGVGARISSLCAFATSLAALGLALKLPGQYLFPGVWWGQVDEGFYLFAGGAVLAIIASLVMVVTSIWHWHQLSRQSSGVVRGQSRFAAGR